MKWEYNRTYFTSDIWVLNNCQWLLLLLFLFIWERYLIQLLCPSITSDLIDCIFPNYGQFPTSMEEYTKCPQIKPVQNNVGSDGVSIYEDLFIKWTESHGYVGALDTDMSKVMDDWKDFPRSLLDLHFIFLGKAFLHCGFHRIIFNKGIITATFK